MKKMIKYFWSLCILFFIIPISDILLIAPLIGAALIGGGLSGLGAYFTGRAQQRAEREALATQQASLEEQRRLEEERRARAREYLTPTTYGYTPYSQQYMPTVSPLTTQARGIISQYLTGQLSPAQQALLESQRQRGTKEITRLAAERGATVGGELALRTQLARDIALGAQQASQQQQQLGLGYVLPFEQYGEAQRRYSYEQSLADYLRQQEAERRRLELLAQYA